MILPYPGGSKQLANGIFKIICGHDGTSARTVLVDSDGYVTTRDANRLGDFNAANIDTSADTKYYGFTDKDGNWYILREVTSTGVFRYCTGSTDYPTYWTNRASQSYDYFHNIF